MKRLEQQLSFCVEVGKLKLVLRQSLLMDSSRRENSAEHSWHVAMMAAVLTEYAVEPVDLTRVLKMLLIHDVVEIDAGDTFAYDETNRATQSEREHGAAERLFALLPIEQALELRSLWEEFEEKKTPEAKYANALDRLQPLLQNVHSGGSSWIKHDVSETQVIARMQPVKIGMPGLWPLVETMVAAATANGYLR